MKKKDLFAKAEKLDRKHLSQIMAGIEEKREPFSLSGDASDSVHSDDGSSEYWDNGDSDRYDNGDSRWRDS